MYPETMTFPPNPISKSAVDREKMGAKWPKNDFLSFFSLFSDFWGFSAF